MLPKTSIAILALAAAASAGEPPSIPLWARGAPGSEGKAGIPEKVEATGNNELRAKGAAQETKGKVKKNVGKAKDAVKGAVDRM